MPGPTQTSLEAFWSLDNLTERQMAVLGAIEHLGQATMDEVAEHLGRFAYRSGVSARLNELHHDLGLIRTVGKRKGRSGRNQQVYEVAR